MRIRQLKLARYGHFTDFNLDFGESKIGTSDLHLIYGKNEAGKSTTLSAIVDLLYGMLPRSRYSFLHDYKTMEIGATLEQNTLSVELFRFKTKLTDRQHQILPESTIDTHGLNRDEFQSRFSFDETTLKEGGEAILGNNGDLGAALFSATSGISDFTSELQKQMEPADQFYEPGKQKGKTLFDIKNQLAEIDEKRKALDVNASYWAKQEVQADEHKARYAEFNTQSQERKAQLDELKRQQQALDLVVRYRALKATLNTQESLPIVPSDWASLAKELVKQQILQQAQLSQLSIQQKTLADQKGNLEIDAQLLTHVPSVETLREERTLFVQRQLDLQAIEIELAASQEEQTRLRNQIDIPDSQSNDANLLSQSYISILRTHIAEYAELKTAFTIAEQEQKNIGIELAQLPTTDAEQPVNTDVLSNYLAMVQDQAYHIKSGQTSTLLTELASELNVKLTKLIPWKGDAEQLINTTTPSRSRLLELEVKLQDVSNAMSVCKTNLQRLDAELESLQGKSTRSLQRNSKPNLTDSRRQRDAVWQQHLESLDNESTHVLLQKSARDYALQQRQLDEITDAELHEAIHKGTLLAAQNQHAQLEVKIESEKSLAAEHGEIHNELLRELQDTARTLNLNGSSSPKELIDWLDHREAVIDVAHRYNKLQSEFEDIEKASHAELTRLRQLIASIDSSSTGQLDAMQNPAELIALAQTTLANKQQSNALLEQKKQKLISLRTRETFRQKQFDEAKSAFDSWNSKWLELIDNSWIETTNVEQVTAILDVLQKLHSAETKASEIKNRIDTLESNQTGFERAANSLLTTLNRQEDDQEHRQGNRPLSQMLDALFADATSALERQTEKKSIVKQEQTLISDIGSLQSSLLPITTQLNSMQEKCAVSDVTELESTLEKIRERASQTGKLNEYEHDLMSILRTDSITDALAKLTDLEEQSLSARINELDNDVERDKIRLAELHHEYRTVQDELDTFNSDATVAQLNQSRQNLLLDLEAQAMQTMRFRLGKLAIEQGVRHFREQHRSTMLDNAKRAFVAITCGNYIDLTTQPGKKNNSEDLVGIKQSGQSTLAIDMSTGTRAQLYLALRIAAYQDYCKTREPLPFVADDIMESFDEQRTQATLKLLNEMATKGQIMYLTHHRHVLDIAKESLGNTIQVHELPQRLVDQEEIRAQANPETA